MNKGIELTNKREGRWWADRRHLAFLLFTLIVCALFYPSLRDLVRLLRAREIYSHIMLVPFVSAYIVYMTRRQIGAEPGHSLKPGIVLVVIGAAFHFAMRGLASSQNDLFSASMFSALVIWTGGFIAFYGLAAYRAALFPMLFLFLMVPLPDFFVNAYTTFLQRGSAEVVNGLFTILGLPAVRHSEYVFSIPNLTFEVARQCSGIRSSIALFIISLFVGRLFLRRGTSRAILALSVIPVTIFKNGLRIFTIVMLGGYVDPRILEGDLHRSGGIPFLFVALAFLAPVFFFLRRSERRGGPGTE